MHYGYIVIFIRNSELHANWFTNGGDNGFQPPVDRKSVVIG